VKLTPKTKALDGSASGDKLNNQYDQRNHQQEMDQVADGSTAESESKSPKNQKYYQNCPKHIFSSYFN